MKKILSFLVLMAGMVGLQLSTALADGNNWMDSVDGDTYVSQMSIPGSHDAATGHGFASGTINSFGGSYAKTQTLTIREQWNVGVRAFDLRPALVSGSNNGNADVYSDLYIWHGIIQTSVTMQSVLETLCDLLDQNPTETAIIICRHETDAYYDFGLYSNTVSDSCTKFKNKMTSMFTNNSKIKNHLLTAFRPDLKLDDVRGKIIFLMRDVDLPAGGKVTNWNQEKAQFLTNDNAWIGPYRLFCVDYWDMSGTDNKPDATKIAHKTEDIERALQYTTQEHFNDAVWVMNEASGYDAQTSLYSSSFPASSGYASNAKTQNPVVINYLNNTTRGGAGIVWLDYSGVNSVTISGTTYNVRGLDLVNAIVNQNSKPGYTSTEYEEYHRALNSIPDGAERLISTTVGGTKYYLTTYGRLTSNLAYAGKFTFAHTQDGGGNWSGACYGMMITTEDGKHFTNASGKDNNTPAQDNYLLTTNDYSRTTFECQVFFQNTDGKYAVRSCNLNSESNSTGWNIFGRTYWTVTDGTTPVANHTFDKTYVWDVEEVPADMPVPNDYYIVGDATPYGWVTGDARIPTQLAETTTPGVYQWTGLLKHGGNAAGNGFFICNTLSGWNGFGASENQVAISDIDSDTYTSSDNKWNPTNADWRFYTITLDTNNGTLAWEAGDFFTTDVEGYYNIGNATDLYWFSVLAKNNLTIKGKLTADIDYTAYPKDIIGDNSHRFAGTFDGQGHTVTLAIDNDVQGTGLFGVVNGATIKNLVVDGSIKASKKWIGGLGGLSYGNNTIENIVVKTAIEFTGSGDATLGGIFGDMEAASTVRNCAFYGSVNAPNGQNIRGLVSWCSGAVQFSNCIVAPIEFVAASSSDYANGGGHTLTNCIKVAGNDARLASGELCYTMNGDQNEINWYQTIGTDSKPVPFSSHSQVYANGQLKCDGTSAGGTLVYSNASTSTVPPHTDVNGWCSVCGNFLPDHLTADAEGFYSIGNGPDLYWFATLVKDINQSAKAKLTADIDYTAYPQGYIGLGNVFSGTFDGQEHTLTIALENDGRIKGLFAKINGATIKNLCVDGSVTSGYNNFGGLGGQADGSNTIENVVVKTELTYTPGSGDASCGGFFPYLNSGTTTFTNCAFYGSMKLGTANGNAGMVGWSSGTVQAANCIIAPVEIQASAFEDYARPRATTTNCVKVAGNDARLASGELCYTMNSELADATWFQNLAPTANPDARPVPFASHGQVYANGQLKCDGTSAGGALVYSNTSTIPPHTDNGNGFCTVCGKANPEHLAADSEGFYHIGNAPDLYWFTKLAEEVEYQSAKAKLTADIDYTAYPQGFFGQSRAFSGTFDGQKHTLTIALVNDGRIKGLFAKINGATIKNLCVDGSVTSGYNNFGGLGGQADGSNTIESVVVKTQLTYTPGSGDASCGGFFPYLNSGTTTFTNCAFYGSMKLGTANGNAGLVGWSSGTVQATNCIIAPVEIEASAFADYARPSAATTNCFKIAGDDARLASGEMCDLLNQNVVNNTMWIQGPSQSHPLPFGNFDVNGDGIISLADVTTLINVIRGNDTVHTVSDFNGDGIVDTSDVTTLVNMLLGK